MPLFCLLAAYSFGEGLKSVPWHSSEPADAVKKEAPKESADQSRAEVIPEKLLAAFIAEGGMELIKAKLKGKKALTPQEKEIIEAIASNERLADQIDDEFWGLLAERQQKGDGWAKSVLLTHVSDATNSSGEPLGNGATKKWHRGFHGPYLTHTNQGSISSAHVANFSPYGYNYVQREDGKAKGYGEKYDFKRKFVRDAVASNQSDIQSILSGPNPPPAKESPLSSLTGKDSPFSKIFSSLSGGTAKPSPFGPSGSSFGKELEKIFATFGGATSATTSRTADTTVTRTLSGSSGDNSDGVDGIEESLPDGYKAKSFSGAHR